MKVREAPSAQPSEESRSSTQSPGRTSLVQLALDGAAAAPGPQQRGVALPLGGGRPLPNAVRIAMQRAFGYDFSSVRVHEGAEAQAMGAIAFARGTDVYFAAGQYNPSSAEGRALIAHEATHVAQQRGGGRQPGQRISDVGALGNSKGDIYTTETYRGQRVQKFTYKGMIKLSDLIKKGAVGGSRINP